VGVGGGSVLVGGGGSVLVGGGGSVLVGGGGSVVVGGGSVVVGGGSVLVGGGGEGECPGDGTGDGPGPGFGPGGGSGSFPTSESSTPTRGRTLPLVSREKSATAEGPLPRLASSFAAPASASPSPSGSNATYVTPSSVTPIVKASPSSLGALPRPVVRNPTRATEPRMTLVAKRNLFGPTVSQPGKEPVPPEVVPRPSIPTVRQPRTKPVRPVASHARRSICQERNRCHLGPLHARRSAAHRLAELLDGMLIGPSPGQSKGRCRQPSLGRRSYQVMPIWVRSPGGAPSNP
jgi:hypothetical protein